MDKPLSPLVLILFKIAGFAFLSFAFCDFSALVGSGL